MSAPAGRISTYDHDGLTFDVLDRGPLDGDVVVLLHGFPERATCWAEIAALLHAQGFRTVAPDQRGYSPGARPPRRRDYRVSLLTADVAALVELVGGPVHLVGHDWGAMVAWSVAGERPDLVRTLTALSVPHPAAFLRAATRSTQGLKSWYMGLFQLPGVAERMARTPGGVMDSFLRRGGMRAVDVARFRVEIVDDGALPGGLAWYRALPFLDRRSAGRKVRVPTTMIWSDGDDFLGRWGIEDTEHHVAADYELVVLTGVNHWIPTQAPAAAAEAILERIVTPRVAPRVAP